jgi:hypothetical protein
VATPEIEQAAQRYGYGTPSAYRRHLDAIEPGRSGSLGPKALENSQRLLGHNERVELIRPRPGTSVGFALQPLKNVLEHRSKLLTRG